MIVQAVIGLAMMLLIGGSLAAWVWAGVRWFHGEPLLEYEPRRPVPWAWPAALVPLVLVAFSLSSLLVEGGSLADADTSQVLTSLAADTVIKLALFAISAGLIVAISGARLFDFGVRIDRLWTDIKIGVFAFIMLAGPVYAVQLVLTAIFGQTRHPLILLIQKNPDPTLIAAMVVVAVIIAPIFEEYAFRLLGQGWLERIAARFNRAGADWADDDLADESTAADDTGFDQPLRAEVIEEKPAYASAKDAFFPPAETSPSKPESPYQSPSAPGAAARANPPWWPIFVSAALFAAAHWSHGPDPAALFVLAIGLGYLYRQTHRILPCIIVHLLLNASSTAALVLSVMTGAEI